MTHTRAIGLGLMFALTVSAASAQQPRARCGPAGVVITTPNQQQSLAASLQLRPMQRTTFRRVGRIQYVVYEDGYEAALMPTEDHMDQYEELGGSPGMGMAKPDPNNMVTLTGDELPWHLFHRFGPYLTPIKSQQGRGLCHAFATAALVESLAMKRLMARGVPEGLAQLDLSEEWMAYHILKQYGTDSDDPMLGGEGGSPLDNLHHVETKPWPLEAYWPYDPESWPTAKTTDDPPKPKYPCGQTYDRREKAEWYYWVHRDTAGQKPPGSIGRFRELTSPDGPLPRLQVKNVSGEADADRCMELAKEQIRRGRPVALSLIWPSQRCVSPSGAMYCVTRDYPSAVQEKLAAGEELTAAETQKWNDFYGEGHVVLLIGYGKEGTDAEGICLVKNSHGLHAGFDGYVYITENLIKHSFPYVSTAELADVTIKDLDRYAETITAGLD